MKRPATIALLTLAAGAGIVLFQVSYDVTELEDRLAQLNRQIVADQKATHVLRAEWSFLNQPARLEELSRRHLDLQPLTGGQIGNAAALPVRLARQADEDGPDRTSLVAATGPVAAPAPAAAIAGLARPLLKPFPPAQAPVRAPAQATDRAAAKHTVKSAAPAPARAKLIPVAARSLDDVLADLTVGGRGRQ